MDHAEARELLEIAAAEPGGLDRLVAGDTPEAAALASHLAGCPECTAEMARIRRAAGLIREVVRSTPPPELRARTLAFIAAVGRERSTAGLAPSIAPAPSPPTPISSAPSARQGAGSRGWWLASLAAAVVVSVVATGLILSRDLDSRLAARDETIGALARVSTWSLRVSGQPDAERVELAAVGEGHASGTLLYSASSRELVVVTSGLVEPGIGTEFRCWVEVDGQRTAIGRMFFGGGLAYWAGDVPEIHTENGATFGISLAQAADPDDLGGEPVIRGEL
jgi:anti-sigma factor RsiW